jgi:3-oxoacyl-[acyl-carrier protein] reductase
MDLGGNRGIGLATARLLLQEGCRVLVCGRDEAKLATAKQHFPQLETIVADITNASAPRILVGHAEKLWGGLDILVNNAGGSLGGGSFSASTDDQWRNVFELNLFGALRLSREASKGMIERGWGRIVHVTSIWGKESGGGAAYNAAKSALISLSKSMAVDLAAKGVLVNSVAPGSVLFEGGGWEQRRKSDPEGIEAWVQKEFPLQRFGRPEEVASMIVFAVSEQASLLSGSCLTVDGGQSKSNV